jgi:DMSO/TMAO reductase YedYZ molybdopterin-dependent catalytic subunit
MSGELSRRETLKRAMAAAAVLAVPEWMLPALAQGEGDVPFTDVPETFNPRNPNSPNRQVDHRTLDGFLTPNDQFFFIQHYNKPEIDAASYRLKLTGLIQRPVELSLADIKAMKSVDIVCGYECSGNSPRAMQGLSSNGRFTGVRLRDVLKRAGVQDQAREVVFFGTDRGNEDVVFRTNTFKVQQQFARSITLENALKPEPILAYALNGEPLDRNHGFPLRVVMPGWYGVANVKWLAEVHLQEARFLGNFQAGGIARCARWAAAARIPTRRPSSLRTRSRG